MLFEKYTNIMTLNLVTFTVLFGAKHMQLQEDNMLVMMTNIG